MSAILKLDFQKREQLRFSEVNYLNYTKKTQFCMWQLYFFLKQGETRTSPGPIPHPLKSFLFYANDAYTMWQLDIIQRALSYSTIFVGSFQGQLFWDTW